jgi:hypothetical protein
MPSASTMSCEIPCRKTKKAAQITGRHSKQKVLQTRTPIALESFKRHCSKGPCNQYRNTGAVRIAGNNREIQEDAIVLMRIA